MGEKVKSKCVWGIITNVLLDMVLKGSSGEKHFIFVIKAHKISRLVAFSLLFLDFHFTQDRLPNVLK